MRFRHALELDDLRISSEQKVSRLEAELEATRAHLSADQESLQDQIFELQDQVKEEAAKLLAALGENELLQAHLQAVEVRTRSYFMFLA